MITPVVGRKVWLYYSAHQAEPIDATIAKVWGDGPEAMVNLDAIDPNTGEHSFHTSVRVGDKFTPGKHYRWMPYQMGQAKAALAVDLAADLAGERSRLPFPAFAPADRHA